jgi:hypothetical protein
MNAVAVFIALLFWGWLWRVWGLLLVPQHVEELQPLAELLGE